VERLRDSKFKGTYKLTKSSLFSFFRVGESRMFCRIPNSFRGSSLLPGPRRVSFPRLESVLAVVISTQDACSSRLSSLVSGLLCRPHELTRTVTSLFAFINAVETPPRQIPARSVFGVILRRSRLLSAQRVLFDQGPTRKGPRRR